MTHPEDVEKFGFKKIRDGLIKEKIYKSIDTVKFYYKYKKIKHNYEEVKKLI